MTMMQSLRGQAFRLLPPRTNRGRGQAPTSLCSISFDFWRDLSVANSGGLSLGGNRGNGNGEKELLAADVKKLAGRAVGGRHSEMESKGQGQGQEQDPRITRISSSIRVIPDFPKPGIMFQDITTLLLDQKAFKDTIDLFVERYKDKNISVVAGIEARGFIFGPPIALAIGAKFVPMRKPRKLPGEVISEEYSLEYGTDTMEMHVGAVQEGERALVVDDLIATGGTLGAAIRLLERVGVTVVECACVIELSELKGREKLGDKPVFVLVSSA